MNDPGRPKFYADYPEFHRNILREYGEEIDRFIMDVQAELQKPIDQTVQSFDMDIDGYVIMSFSSAIPGAWRNPYIAHAYKKTPFVIEAREIREVRDDELHLLSHQARADRVRYQVQQTLIDTIRNQVYELYKKNGFKAPEPDHPPILYVDSDTPSQQHILRALRESDVPLIALGSLDEVQNELRGRGLSEQEIQAKITGVTHPMRSDAELPGLAEVLRAMPASEVKNPGKSSRRPALPRNKKRDRWN